MKVFLRIVIIFLLVTLMSGCGQKYLDSREEELLDRKILNSWSNLDTKIVAQDYKGISLNVQVKDFIGVRDSLKLKEFYKHGFGRKDTGIKINYTKILIGCAIGGCAVLASSMSAYSWMNDPSDDIYLKLAWCYGVLGGITALYFILDGLVGFSRPKSEPYYIKKDGICIDSTVTSVDKVKVIVENKNFEKIYYTDEFGNINLKFNEIIPEPAEADSIINLIVRYEEMVDSLKVRRL
jgi:hypothetical protein